MAKYVFSTLSADTLYTPWRKNNGLNTPGPGVLVKGGAGIALRGVGHNISTPVGRRTEVTDDEAEFLQKHPHFQDHMKGGFVKITNKDQDADKAAASMAVDKGSAPRTVADVKAENEKNKDPDAQPLQAVTNKK